MNKFMKKTGIVSVFVVAMALVVVVTGVFAQGPATPDLPAGSGQMRNENSAGTGLGVMAVDQAEMHAAIADALGMTLENFELALATGQTPYTLALELGVDFSSIQAATSELHAAALEQATADGLITQERTNWMLGHQTRRSSGVDGTAAGIGNMTRGAGNMAGFTGNQDTGGVCLYDTP
jgi:hypothetical protein